MRVSCRTSFSHATLSGIDSGHVFVPRANYCRLIFKLDCICDLSPKEVIQSHWLLTYVVTRSAEYATDEGLRNHRFQSVAFHFRTNAFYEWKTGFSYEIVAVANGE